jgi:hypothetical protein
MDRHLTNYNITWFLEAARNKQLDLDPPYQRRSVWTRKDKQFFLDTVFRNYPCPAIFLHTNLDENGRPTYHVVDGKQRLQTIIEFAEGKIRMADDYGDNRLDSKRWQDVPAELRGRFWAYKLVVEELSFEDPKEVNDIFDRINRNARKLTRQELRHAKYDGWFISQVEHEIEQPEWKALRLVTQARESRMADSQFLSELMLLTLDKKIQGFDQDGLDKAYADFDDISAADSMINEDDFLRAFSQTKRVLLRLEEENDVVTRHCRTFNNFYSLWAFITLASEVASLPDFAKRYDVFMGGVENHETPELTALYNSLQNGDNMKLGAAIEQYTENLRGANTDRSPRQLRHDALATGLGYIR